MILHSGACRLTLNGQTRNLLVDHAYMLLPGFLEEFRFSRDHSTHHSWCTMTPHALPTELIIRFKDLPSSVPCSDTFHRLLSCAFHLERRQSASRDGVIDTIGEALFTEFIHIADQAKERRSLDGSISQALRYMEDHFPEGDCLEQMHSLSDVSRNTLITKFKEHLGTTPNRYLWQLRTERGIALLTETGLTIAEIAGQCGFKNPYHFSRKVTQYQGQPPKACRRQAWQVES